MSSTMLDYLEDTLSKLRFAPPKGWDVRLSPRFLTYSPKFIINVETPAYELKTAQTMDELIKLFELRYQVFFGDVKEPVAEDELELDEFDSNCDHIIIRCKETDRIVGTYRILCSLHVNKFYSQGEFNLDQFLNLPETKMELGRACIHHGHRNGHVIDLLWKGLAEYIKFSGSKYMFGCSSIMETDLSRIKSIYDYMKDENLISSEYGIHPIGKYAIENLEELEADPTLDARAIKKQIPSLLRSYMNAGAKIYGAPALDKDFRCIDFLTIIDLENLNSMFKKRYLKL
jgi:putative hemolysin